MTEKGSDGDAEWKLWWKRERADRYVKRLIFILLTISIYPLSKVYDAVSLGEVQKFSTRGSPAIYHLSANAGAYYYNTAKWCIWAALCLIGAVGLAWQRRKGEAHMMRPTETKQQN